ncbi:phosphotransferase family protein [Seohaeicola zhoushanensis]
MWRTDGLADRLAAYLTDQMREPVAVSALKRFTAGLSWVTVLFVMHPSSGGVREAILRIGDPNGLLAPYSTLPEYLTFTTLNAETAVPVPRVLWHSDDPATFGAPFLIVTRLRGETLLPRWPGAETEVPYPHAKQVTEDFATHLAAIHGCAWRGTPIEALTPGRRSRPARIEKSTAGACMRRARPVVWKTMPCAMRPDGCTPMRRNPTRLLLHGDYRVGNFLVDDGRISGLLDWELTHLGDPHEDLAWAAMRTFGGTRTTLSGLLDLQAFQERYTAASGRQVDQHRVRYFQVLGQFKMASMLVGTEQRLRNGDLHDIRLAVMVLQKATTLMGMLKMIEIAA